MKMVEFSDMHMMVANPEKVRKHVENILFWFCSVILCPLFRLKKTYLHKFLASLHLFVF